MLRSMLSKIYSGSTIGLDGVLIRVEVDVSSRGFPTFTIVGLPNKAIDEAKERVRIAIRNSGFDMPDAKIIVNLAPADIPKEGSSFDLPIAIGILTSAGMIERSQIPSSMFIGELSLDGKVRSVPGVLPIAILARDKKIQSLFVPRTTSIEASFIKELDVYPVNLLTDVILHLNGHKLLEKSTYRPLNSFVKKELSHYNFADVKGQDEAKRALEIAAAGFHNVHLTGPPGAGKTLLARSFPTVLPLMDEEEMIEACKIYSISGNTSESSFSLVRPFRAPHHTISRVGLIGGGNHLMPGEISLSHRGVLFLDEFPEFPRSVIEALRQPLEDGHVSVVRARGSVTFPARFIMLCASNPCPCGFLGHPKKQCSCGIGSVLKYKKKLSGPIMDRIDIHVVVPPVDEEKLTAKTESEKSELIRERVLKAHAIQRDRFKSLSVKSNGEMTPTHIKKLCALSPEAELLLKQAVSRLSLSARSYFKIIKISQTIADLSKSVIIEAAFVAEALQFRVQEE